MSLLECPYCKRLFLEPSNDREIERIIKHNEYCKLKHKKKMGHE